MIEGDRSLALCCGVPMIRNSVLEGLTVSLLAVSQLWKLLSVVESEDRHG